MNSGSTGGICTLPLLCENFSGAIGGQYPLAPSAYAHGDRYTDRQIDNLVANGPMCNPRDGTNVV